MASAKFKGSLALEIMQDYRAEITITVDDTTGKTYTSDVRDRMHRQLGEGGTATVVDATTVKLTLTAEQTAKVYRPRCLDLNESLAFAGYWYIYVDDGDAAGEALEAYGPVRWLRPAEW